MNDIIKAAQYFVLVVEASALDVILMADDAIFQAGHRRYGGFIWWFGKDAARTGSLALVLFWIFLWTTKKMRPHPLGVLAVLWVSCFFGYVVHRYASSLVHEDEGSLSPLILFDGAVIMWLSWLAFYVLWFLAERLLQRRRTRRVGRKVADLETQGVEKMRTFRRQVSRGVANLSLRRESNLILFGIIAVVIAGSAAYLWLGQSDERHYARIEAYKSELRNVSSQLRIGQSQDEVRRLVRLRVPRGFRFIEDSDEGGDMLFSPHVSWFVRTKVVLSLDYKGGKLRKRIIHERSDAL